LALFEKTPVYWIECEGTFDVDRLLDIAEVRGLITPDNKDTFLDNLHYASALTTDDIERVVNTCVPKILEKKIELIVIDGAIGKYRLEYDAGRGDLNQRQNDIKPVLKHLMNMAELLNLAIVSTNQVMGNPDGFGEPDKPIGGHVVGHNFRYILRFNKGAGNKRIARFVKSNKHAISDAEFWLNREGVSDIDVLKKKKTEEVTPSKRDEGESPDYSLGEQKEGPIENQLIETELLDDGIIRSDE
jgi:meiotic recombination protein DMC1